MLDWLNDHFLFFGQEVVNSQFFYKSEEGRLIRAGESDRAAG